MKKVSILLALLLSLSCYGCSSNSELIVEKKDITIEVLVTSKTSKFWETVEQGVNDASEELGINIVFEAPESEADIDEQIELLQNAIDNNVNAIIISPLDSEKLNNTFANANARNIPILTIDNTATYDGIESAIGTQNDIAGAIALDNLSKLMNENGEIAIVKHSNTTVINKRYDGFIQELDNYPNMKLVDTLEANGDKEIIPDMIKQCLDKNPNIKGFLATNQTSTIAICDTLASLNRSDIYVVGFDASDIEIEYIKNNILTGTMVQNPYLMGYLGVRNAYKLINNESVDSIIDTGVTYVDALNLTDEDIEILIYPMGKKEG